MFHNRVAQMAKYGDNKLSKMCDMMRHQRLLFWSANFKVDPKK
jgi:hypothetical protein